MQQSRLKPLFPSVCVLAAWAMLASAPAYGAEQEGATSPAKVSSPSKTAAQPKKAGSADHKRSMSTGMSYSEKASKGMKSNPMGAANQITGTPSNPPLSSGGDDGSDKTGN